MSADARPQPLTLLTTSAPGAELAACEGDSCLVPSSIAAPRSPEPQE
ncbi:hypothetical protein [Chryseoglobus sp. 28M-23]|nr:hypothetical protein [Chryseoglobus sp. 28M-23]MBU1251247.1 hypothetical protein [Actinomycetota bacterium]MBU1609524.1 hypothetical protein [Actinomycetota bacterium]MBU2315359.1 hypothetical protein [Actinomycetota bacterium]MBU2385557.1 hypothetical protein [Actinomycetota bacterium]QOD94635.1 hypothetical protein IE160_05445 [Chryseoglobus sp. 28M-23]